MTGPIRRAGPADVAAITALTHAAYTKWETLIGCQPLPMRVDYAQAVVAHRIDVVDEPDGMVALVETELRSTDLLIVNVAVAPAAQGRGLGRRMIAHAEELAAQAGRAEVRLYTNARFAANLRLYAALGYREKYAEAVDVGVRIHMVKTL